MSIELESHESLTVDYLRSERFISEQKSVLNSFLGTEKSKWVQAYFEGTPEINDGFLQEYIRYFPTSDVESMTVSKLKLKYDLDSEYTKIVEAKIQLEALDTNQILLGKEQSRKLIESILSRSVLIDRNIFQKLSNLPFDKETIAVLRFEGSLPISNIIDAENFTSWDGREHSQMKFSEGIKTDSKTVIEDYASRPSPIPPIEQLEAYITKDKDIFFCSGNAHRAGAYKLKWERGELQDFRFDGRLVLREIDCTTSQLFQSGIKA